MQIAPTKVAEVFGDTSGATEVSIKLNAFTFEALSGDKLYKNLKRAIVRELACNAYDAHVMAGNAHAPFDIHLPTEFEPFFGIRDYGIGLDDEGVRKVYLTYFDSTKRNDNTVIGAWGLGSKSPLGYTDNFTITAFKDGVSRMYAVFKKPDTGIPAVNLLATVPTDQPNGLYIQMPVKKSSDFSAFRNEAADVLSWFPVRPNVNVDLALKQHEYIIRDITAGVHLRKSDGSYNEQKMIAVQGMIAYPISLPDDEAVCEEARDLLKYRLEMHFDLGELQFSMSREELSYSEMTLKAIEKKLLEVRAALEPRLVAEIASKKTDWEKAIMLEAFSNDWGNIMKTAADNFVKDGKSPVHEALFNGKLGAKGGISKTKYDAKGIDVRAFRTDIRHSRSTSIKSVCLRDAGFNSTDSGANLYVGFRPDNSIVFVLNDAPKRYKDRIRLQYGDCDDYSKRKHIIVIGAEKGCELSAVHMAEITMLVKALGNPELVKVSDMPEPPKVVRANGMKKGDVMVMYRNRSGGTSWTTADDVAEDDDKLFVELNGHEIVNDDMFTGYSTSKLKEITDRLRKHKLIGKELVVYGIRKSALSKIADDETWTKLSDAVKDGVAEKKIDEKMLEVIIKRGAVDWLFCRDDIRKALGKEHLPVITEVFEQHSKHSKVIEGFDDSLVELLVELKLVKQLDKSVESVHNEETVAFTKFPMLRFAQKYVSSWQLRDGQAVKELVQYVEDVKSNLTK